MKKMCFISFLFLAVVSISVFGQTTPADPARVAADTLKALSVEVRGILKPEILRNVFGNAYRLQELGLSYQPQLLAPTKIDPKWNRCQLRQFAGIKQFDVIYAIAFRKHQDVAAGCRTLDEVFTALDLRSQADWSGRTFAMLRKAAADPESADTHKLLEDLADTLIDTIPTAMSNPETAHFFLDSLYGFSIQYAYVVEYFNQNDATKTLWAKLRKLQKTPVAESWSRTTLRVFQAFEQAGAKLGLKCESPEKMAFYTKVADTVDAQRAGKVSRKKLQERWSVIDKEIVVLRDAMLTPKSK